MRSSRSCSVSVPFATLMRILSISAWRYGIFARCTSLVPSTWSAREASVVAVAVPEAAAREAAATAGPRGTPPNVAAPDAAAPTAGVGPPGTGGRCGQRGAAVAKEEAPVPARAAAGATGGGGCETVAPPAKGLAGGGDCDEGSSNVNVPVARWYQYLLPWMSAKAR